MYIDATAPVIEPPNEPDIVLNQDQESLPPTRSQSLLRFLTCGSVDDGKSTLIGRMLYDAKVVPSDHLEALVRDSRRFGTRGNALDFALLVDGLSAEREQGITIDVAYRYFSTPRRAFIVADTPGHEQYTRNMATGASNAEVAVILLDASQGILPQTRRHSFITSMMGVRHVVLAVNKMDLAGFDEATFEHIVATYRDAVAGLGFETVTCIPLCAREGDNVVRRSARMPWYQGPSLLSFLETVETSNHAEEKQPFRMQVQWVNRPSAEFRGYAGTIASGECQPGDAVTVLPSGLQTEISRIVTADGDLDQAGKDQAVTFVLKDAIDISRGDCIVATGDQARLTTSLRVRLLWMTSTPLQAEDSYILQLGAAKSRARVASFNHAIDIHSFETRPCHELTMNQIGEVRLRLDQVVAAIPYDESRELGSFILIDPLSHETAALGMILADERIEEPKPAKKEWHMRSFLKGVSWRFVGSLDTFLLSWLITGRLSLAGSIASVETFTKIGLFYLHERAWGRWRWGQTEEKGKKGE